MSQTNCKVYKKNMLLSIFVLFTVQIMTVFSITISFRSHRKDSYDLVDITTIYRITNMSIINSSTNVGFKDRDFLRIYKGNYLIELHLRTNANRTSQTYGNQQALDEINNNRLYDSRFSDQNNDRIKMSYSLSYWRKQYISYEGRICENYKDISLGERDKVCYQALEYEYSGSVMSDLKLTWIPDEEQTCLTITYIHTSKSRFDIAVEILDISNNTLITTISLEKQDIIRTLQLSNAVFNKNHMYNIIVKENIKRDGFTVSYYGFWFALLRIDQCSNNVSDVFDLTANYRIPSITTMNSYKNDHSGTNNTNSTNPCSNGGFVKSQTTACTCPTGFTGLYCQTGCNMNSYGADCKGVCSVSKNMCRGMFMCTNYGCTCPAGLTGPLCNEDCTLGRYGADCQQTCSPNCHNNTCNKYTGVCSQGCSSGYQPPYCLKKYPYFLNPPRLLSSHYHSIEMEINFQSDNVISRDTSINLKYYQLFYKSPGDKSFRNSDIKLITPNNEKTTDILNDLEFDSEYIVGVMIITDNGNFNDQDIVYGHYRTSCKYQEQVSFTSNLIAGRNSINVTWNTVNQIPLSCKVAKHRLMWFYNHPYGQQLVAQEVILGSNFSHIIDDLLPGFEYTIQVIPGLHNDSYLNSYPPRVIRTRMTEQDMVIKDIAAKSTEDRIKVSWELVNFYQQHVTYNTPNITCVVRYKVKRIFSCSLKEIEQNWTSITVYNQTKYEITDTVPNSQYCIQVLINVNDATTTTQPENNVYVLTPATNPKTAPVFDIEHPLYVTNNSVSFYWKTNDNCSKLNGFFSNFYIELRNKNNNVVQIKDTKQNNITFNDLTSNTPYELKVFIKTHIGYDSEHFLFTNFTTKYENLKPVDDLVVYKKSLKNRVVGFRWSYLENTHLDGFITSFNEDSFANIKNISVISPTRCSAWPQYYCHTIRNLIPSKNYTFKIKAKSLEYPEGGKESSIYFSSIDGIPDAPNNLQAIDIGNTYISLKWDIPWILNGILKSFSILVEEISASDMNTCCVTIAPMEILIDKEVPSYNYTLTDLKAGSTYSIGVLTVSTSSWYSSPARISTTTLLDI